MLVAVEELMASQQKVKVDMLGMAADTHEPVKPSAKHPIGISQRVNHIAEVLKLG